MHYLLYHANCADGFAAMCCARLRLGTHNVTYRPIQYSDEVQFPPEIVRGDVVTYLDYTPKMPTIQSILDHEARIECLDHHETAKPIHDDALVPWESTFDLHRSGAGLAWDRWHGENDGRPQSIQLIQWRDLGHAWHLQHKSNSNTLQSFQLHAFLMRTLPRTFEAWEPWLFRKLLEPALAIGQQILDLDTRLIQAATADPLWLMLGSYKVPALTGIPYSIVSDALNALVVAYPEAPFAAAWFIDRETGLITYSLRGRGDFHCGDFARRQDKDGGGHANAAGFTTDKAPVLWSTI